jgi:DNA-binding NarL/FixJ family response regulator
VALAARSPETCVISATTAPQAMAALAENCDLDVVIVDPVLAGTAAMSLISSIRAQYETLAIIALTEQDEARNVHMALRAGATGFVSKSSPTRALLSMVEQVTRPGRLMSAAPSRAQNAFEGAVSTPELGSADPVVLTGRQREVLSCLCIGKTNREIGDQLGVTEKTVKGHVTSLLKHLGVANRTQAALAALRVGLVGN